MYGLVEEASLYVAQGIVIAVIGYLIYSVHERGFEVLGKYRTKEGSQAFIILFLAAAGFAGPILLDRMETVVQDFSPLQVIGGVVVVSRLYINHEVPYWNQDDEKSLAVIAVGVLMIVYPIL